MTTEFAYQTRRENGEVTSSNPFFPLLDIEVIESLGLKVYKVYVGSDFDPVLHSTTVYNSETGGWEYFDEYVWDECN